MAHSSTEWPLGKGYMAATAAKREPRKRRCRQHSRRPEPTLGAIRGPRTLSMSRRSPVVSE